MGQSQKMLECIGKSLSLITPPQEKIEWLVKQCRKAERAGPSMQPLKEVFLKRLCNEWESSNCFISLYCASNMFGSTSDDEALKRSGYVIPKGILKLYELGPIKYDIASAMWLLRDQSCDAADDSTLARHTRENTVSELHRLCKELQNNNTELTQQKSALEAKLHEAQAKVKDLVAVLAPEGFQG